MSKLQEIEWGAKNMASWLFLIFAIFLLSYLIWLFFLSSKKIGENCTTNNDCASKICYVEEGRKSKYCSKRCTSDSQCPKEWRCLAPPYMPHNIYICVKP